MSNKHCSDFAVVVGINDYSDDTLALTSPQKDAEKIAEWLQSKTGGNLPNNNIRLLIAANGTQVDQNSIQRALVDAKNFSESWFNTKGVSARRLYFYFSGHGASYNTEVLLCHSLWCDDWPNANLNVDKLDKNYINPCTYFDEVVFWLDCCRSLDAAYVSNVPEIGCHLPRGGAEKQKTMISYATLDTNYAYEAVSRNSQCSLYTQVLLAALKYRGRKEDNKVSWRSVERHLLEYVPALAQRHNLHQNSSVDFKRVSSHEDPVFCDIASIPKIKIKLNKDQGNLTIKDSSLRKIMSINISSDTISVELKPGKYLAIYDIHSREFQVDGVAEVIYVHF
jgi:hypothetical protein